MNKLLFKYDRNFNDNIILIANNHKDLEDYLRANYDWFKIAVNDDTVRIIEREGYETEFVNLEWVKQI
jgi:hypothetical protein